MKKIIIGYLCSGYVKTSSLKNFLYNFKKYQPGYNYELLICFKNLSKLEKKTTKTNKKSKNSNIQ